MESKINMTPSISKLRSLGKDKQTNHFNKMCEVLLEGQYRILWEQKAGISNLGLGMSGKKLRERAVAEESSAQLKSYKVLSTYSHNRDI